MLWSTSVLRVKLSLPDGSRPRCCPDDHSDDVRHCGADDDLDHRSQNQCRHDNNDGDNNNNPEPDNDDNDPELDIVEHHHDDRRYVIDDNVVAIVP